MHFRQRPMERLVIHISLRVRTKNYFPHFATKTHVLGAQKNRLIETVLLSSQNMRLN